jgi:hypothetical protein
MNNTAGEEAPDSGRYISLGLGQYFDTTKSIIVEKRGEKFILLDVDRRKTKMPITIEKRKRADKASVIWIPLGKNLFFDKVERVIMRKMGAKMILYTRERRIASEQREGIREERKDRTKE